MIIEEAKSRGIVQDAISVGDFELAAILSLLIKYPSKNAGGLNPIKIVEVKLQFEE